MWRYAAIGIFTKTNIAPLKNVRCHITPLLHPPSPPPPPPKGPGKRERHCCGLGYIVAHDVSWAAQTGKPLLRTRMFLNKRRIIFCVPQQMLRARANGETFVSATMCPQQCVLVCQSLNGHIDYNGHFPLYPGGHCGEVWLYWSYRELVVSVLDCRSRVRSRALSGDILLCSWAKHLPFTVPSPLRSINGYGRFNAVGNPTMDVHPIQMGVKTFLFASCYWNRK